MNRMPRGFVPNWSAEQLLRHENEHLMKQLVKVSEDNLILELQNTIHQYEIEDLSQQVEDLQKRTKKKRKVSSQEMNSLIGDRVAFHWFDK